MISRKALMLTAVVLSACQEPAPIAAVIPEAKIQALPPISKQFACLPQEAAFIAAHRGVSKKAGLPENSLSGLQVLINQGYLFAEVDISSIKDRTHILFHDGIWDDKSTGNGPVAATPQSVFQTIRLRDTDGNITAETVSTLDDYLQKAKDNIYLEIDFKSSADYETVITKLRDNDMADQVLLIAYNDRQAKRLAELAPDMMISASAKTDAELKTLQNDGLALDKIAIWRGRSPTDSKFLKALREKGVPVLRQAPKNNLEKTAKIASLIVTDYASDFKPIIGLTHVSEDEYKACINN